MALTGHLSDLSLSELIEFFCNQRKVGRIKVLYPQGFGYFYLQAGSVVDARIGVLRGIEAVYYALTLANAKFEFSGSSEPMDRTINQPWTQVVLDSEPPPSPRLILKSVSGGVLNGTALNLPSPVYPDSAKRMRIFGIVSVDVIVDETGKVISAQATRGPASLREAAVQAAKRARFSPTTLSGEPVRVAGVINYNFALSQ